MRETHGTPSPAAAARKRGGAAATAKAYITESISAAASHVTQVLGAKTSDRVTFVKSEGSDFSQFKNLRIGVPRRDRCELVARKLYTVS